MLHCGSFHLSVVTCWYLWIVAMLTKMIRVINHSSKQLTIKVWEFGAVALKHIWTLNWVKLESEVSLWSNSVKYTHFQMHFCHIHHRRRIACCCISWFSYFHYAIFNRSASCLGEKILRQHLSKKWGLHLCLLLLCIECTRANKYWIGNINILLCAIYSCHGR